MVESMGNTVGSKDCLHTAEDFYILGLWLADGYWRASSIGLTSVESRLITRFNEFLRRTVPQSPIKIREYFPKAGEKRKLLAWQTYVNNRALTRMFLHYKQVLPRIPEEFLPAYLAGRIDGDGHIDRKHRIGHIRIAYGSLFDAQRDQQLLGITNVSLYQYTAAKTYVLYLRKSYRNQILQSVAEFSIKLAP